MDEKYLKLSEAIRDGDEDESVEAAKALLEQDVSPLDIFTKCVEPTLNVLGEQFAKLEIFLPDLITAGDAVKALQELLLPVMKEKNIASRQKGTAVIATVYGDIHDIGKNMVTLMMEINGYKMYDLGVDIPPVAIIQKAEETKADLICLSGLMLPSLPYMYETIKLAKNNNNLKAAKVMVGGGPVTQEWADRHGADGYSDDAMGAVRKADELMRIA
jgi:Predicted cobalamin binding protein